VCPVGTYSGVSAATCTSCEAGKYQPEKGSSSCISCLPGTYGTETKQTMATVACHACTPGKYSAALGAPDAAICNPCAAGKYGSESGMASSDAGCALCAVHTYGPSSGASSSAACQVCAQGFYQDEPGQVSCKDAKCGTGEWGTGLSSCADCPRSCTACPPGTYNPSVGVGEITGCIDCPLARYGTKSGAKDLESGCLICWNGTYGNERGLSTPMCSGLCPVGTYSIPGLTQCLNCSVRQFSNAPGSASCTSCPEHETSEEGASACECEEGYYRTTSPTSGGGGSGGGGGGSGGGGLAGGGGVGGCIPCPDGLNCTEKGSTLANANLQPDTWRQSSTDRDFLACPVIGTCMGGSDVDDYCRPGHPGPLCAVCDHNYTRLQTTARCTQCPVDMSLALFWTFLALLACVGVLAVFLLVNRKVRLYSTNSI
jgi:hypothetical protein